MPPLLGLLLAQAFGGNFFSSAPSGGASSASTHPPTAALYGDSIAGGVCSGTGPAAVLDSLLPSGWVVSTNAGDGQPPALAGLTAAQIRARYEATRLTACLGEPCGWVLIEGGVNSLRAGVAPTAAVADLVAIADDAHSRGYGVVWLSNVLPYDGPGETDALARATAFNSAAATECASRSWLTCVPAYSTFDDPGNPGALHPDYVCATDTLHLKQAGSNLLAQLLRDALP